MSLPESNGKTILITGTNGYITNILGLQLLPEDYSSLRPAAAVADANKAAPYTTTEADFARFALDKAEADRAN
ncbi:uncharacterized protein RSE6_03596 [Rhynchosporium secalis]|uniref:NAD-dependent epimerase/dehydratase domain-containing protein n=1 Tax=Rhynchosporium secalis TaxID=38038 RepID=A0A1E1M370_RHYSE|nr:uncharacterized protein RSE6_03596 [Rhynchosporium secalis]